MKVIRLITAVLVFSLAGEMANAQFSADLQGGPVFTGYNDVRIPGDDGTRFSLKDELDPDMAWSFRAEAGYTFAEKHYLGFMATPLRVTSRGTLDRDLQYNGETFAEGTELTARFRFDSYRMTYRYKFYAGEVFTFGAGFTAKIRDAGVSVKGGGMSTEKKNTGFVPILNFAVEASLPAGFFAYLGGDALAAPQGRAEDVALLLGYRISENFRVKAGYRILEGGADNDEVYTFSMFHYAVIGADAVF